MRPHLSTHTPNGFQKPRARWHESVYAFCVVAAHRHSVPPAVCRKIVVEYVGPWARQTELVQGVHAAELKKIMSGWVRTANERKRTSRKRRGGRGSKYRIGGGGDGATKSSMCTIS